MVIGLTLLIKALPGSNHSNVTICWTYKIHVKCCVNLYQLIIMDRDQCTLKIGSDMVRRQAAEESFLETRNFYSNLVDSVLFRMLNR